MAALDYTKSPVHVLESIAKLAQSTVVLTAATGVTGNTVNDVGGAFNQTTLNNNFKVVADKINEILNMLKVD